MKGNESDKIHCLIAAAALFVAGGLVTTLGVTLAYAVWGMAAVQVIGWVAAAILLALVGYGLWSKPPFGDGKDTQ